MTSNIDHTNQYDTSSKKMHPQSFQLGLPQSAEQGQMRFRNRKLDFHAFLPRSSCLSEAICGQRIKRGSTISNILERYFVDVG